jgi:hypothetical protein
MANPKNYEEKDDMAFAEKEARPFLKKLEAAYSDVFDQLELVKGNHPKLEKRCTDIETLQTQV